jgi:hypothetical protein
MLSLRVFRRIQEASAPEQSAFRTSRRILRLVQIARQSLEEKTMKTPRKLISTVLATGLAMLLVGCSSQPIFPSLNAGIPVPSDALVLGPNEKISLDALTAPRREYFCSNGAALQCERFGLKLDCSCPGLRP